jgi:hypothetical protein
LKKEGQKLRGQKVLPWLGIVICLYLIYSTSISDKVIGSIVILAGIPLYVYYSPKVDLADLKADFLASPEVTRRYLEKTDRFLGRLFWILRVLVRRLKS